MSKNVTFLLITFDAFFQTFFNGFEISVKFCVFLYPYWIFERKFFFALISTCCKNRCTIHPYRQTTYISGPYVSTGRQWPWQLKKNISGDTIISRRPNIGGGRGGGFRVITHSGRRPWTAPLGWAVFVTHLWHSFPTVLINLEDFLRSFPAEFSLSPISDFHFKFSSEFPALFLFHFFLLQAFL